MKKISYLLSISFLMLLSCSSGDSDTKPEVVNNDVKPPFTIKYELIFSKPLSLCSNGCSANVKYTTDEKYVSLQLDYIYKGSQVWTKTVTATLPNNPYQVSLSTDAKLIEDGTITFNFYVNGTLYKQYVENRKASDGAFIGIGTSIY